MKVREKTSHSIELTNSNVASSLEIEPRSHCYRVVSLTPVLTVFQKVNREFKIYDATVAKTSLKIASSSFSIYFAIMSVWLTFES